MSDEFYSKGTIKIENQDGILEPFHPKTDFSSVEDAEGTTLTQIISNISTQIDEAENSGGIELMFEEPDAENTADFSNETMIAYLQPETWSFTIDTEATAAGERKTGIPFNFSRQNNAFLTVDWGDGSTSQLGSEDYEDSDSTASVHEYDVPGKYAISLTSNRWDEIRILTIENDADITTINDAVAPLYWWRRTLVSVDSMLPKVKGKAYYSNPTSTSTLAIEHRSFSYLFCRCKKLETIPYNLFHNNEDNQTFSHCFYMCNSLQSIPEGLFDYAANVSSFHWCFSNCRLITSIPENIFYNSPNVSSFEECFWYCSSIASIPSTLFSRNTKARYFSGCFTNCTSITSIPEDLFKNATLAESFSGCFQSCTSLQAIPAKLFEKNIKVINFSWCFNNCTSLESIPSELFATNVLATDFSSCFYQCSSIESIPSNLFASNTAAVSFSKCFYQCRSIESISSNLFASNTAARNFEYCFYQCNSITSIPSDLFANNTAVIDFSYCFSGTAIQTIPSGLFVSNTAVTDLDFCFFSCSNLQDFAIHIGSSLVSNIINFVSSKSGTTRTVYVPSESTTETTFNTSASSLGLTIIGE